jgi:hypothetical protein
MRVHRVTALVRTAASAGDGSVLANGRQRLGAMPASSTKWPKCPSKREAWPSVGGTSRPLPGAAGRHVRATHPADARHRSKRPGCAGQGGAGPPGAAGPAVLSPRGRPPPPAMARAALRARARDAGPPGPVRKKKKKKKRKKNPFFHFSLRPFFFCFFFFFFVFRGPAARRGWRVRGSINYPDVKIW